jgi:hypothetical protein
MKWLEHAGIWSSSSFCSLMVNRVSISASVFSSFYFVFMFICSFVLCVEVILIRSCRLRYTYLFACRGRGEKFNLLLWLCYSECSPLRKSSLRLQDRTKTCFNFGN